MLDWTDNEHFEQSLKIKQISVYYLTQTELKLFAQLIFIGR